VPRTIKGLLVTSAAVFTGCLFVLVWVSLALVYDRSTREDAIRDAGTLARVTFGSMFQLMVTGWNRQQLEDFVASLDLALAGSPSRILIHRGEPVTALFGSIEQPAADMPIRQAMESGRTVEIHDGDEVRFVFPLKAEAVCVACHTNVTPGTALGAIDVRQSVARVIEGNRQRLALIALPAIPVTFFATLLLVMYIDRRLGRAIHGLGSDLAAINRVSDLSKLADRAPHLGFAELDRIGHEIGRLTGRLRSAAVDRDMLQLEIRLLEKFVISAQAVGDWRDYVTRLLVEINAVLPAYALFALFRDEADRLELEVFWLHAPSEALRARFEAALPLRPAHARHHIAHAAVPLREIDEADLRRHMRALTVDGPRIGGIQGVGMQAQLDGDATRLLVIESALATLMNVVGSVRAIHHYTEQLEFHATRDPLTGLYTQRVFWDLLENEIVRARRYDESVALLVIDLDEFKTINDSHGHAFGDVCLQTIAGALRGALRAGDLVVRYGGDEFVAILPATALDEARGVADRILAGVAGLGMLDPQDRPFACSVSIGLAVCPDHATDKRELFLIADNMMYRAKAAGRNRAVLPGPDDALSR